MVSSVANARSRLLAGNRGRFLNVALFVIIGLVIMFGPIVWALSVGWRGGAPESEDAEGLTAWGGFIKRFLTGGRGEG